MYEMLVGQPLFVGKTAREVAQQHLLAEPPRVAAVVFDCPVWLDSLVHQLVQKDPAQRLHGASAVLLALHETQQRVAAKTGVVEHAAGGFSPLQRMVDKDLARKLLNRARQERRDRIERDGQRPPLYERAWFLAACLLLMLSGIGAWLFWPVSEARLWGQARRVLAEQEGIQQEEARPLLEALLERFPESARADEARVMLDELDMASAERRLQIRAKLGREPRSEAERLYAEAWNYEQFGDRLTALDKYRSLLHLLGDDPQERPFLNLARRQIDAIQRDTSAEERIRFLEERLAEAERLADAGRLVDARRIWSSVVNLYAGNRELSVHVERAQNKLAEELRVESEELREKS
jgi:hypothetical protein